MAEQSLNDWPGKIVYPVLLKGCNFQCGFCFVPHLLLNEKINREEIIKEISELDKKWYDGILISGGEPTIHSDLPELLGKIKALGFKTRLFTNGSNPEMLKLLIDKKLVDSIAMDIKHTKEKYSEICGVNINIKNIEESMILVSKLEDYSFRTTLIPKFHKKQDAYEVFNWIKQVIGKKPRYNIQNFYEKAESYLNESFKNEKRFPDSEIEEINKEIQNIN